MRPVKTACFEVIDSFPKPGLQVSIYQGLGAQWDPSGPDLRLDEVVFLDSEPVKAYGSSRSIIRGNGIVSRI